MTEKLHVVFSPSAAATLRQALAGKERSDRVICPFGDASFGPIDTDDAAARAAWIEDELGISDWQDETEGDIAVVSECLSSAHQMVAWVMPNSAHCVAGFLWWLSYMEGRPVAVISSPNVSILGPNELAALLGSEIQLNDWDRGAHLEHWRMLQRENAPFRVIEAGQLVSAPIDYFDRDLLTFVTREWQKMARIIATMFGRFFDDEVYQAGDFVLGARLATLAEAGVIEWQGDLSDMRGCELRLPANAKDQS